MEQLHFAGQFGPALSSSLGDFYAEAKRADVSRRAELKRRQKAHQAHLAGKASGRSRKAKSTYRWGRAVPHQRDRAGALALAYSPRQMTRAQFDRLYERTFDYVNDRGRETTYELYRALFARYRASTQDFRTTNSQQALALARRGRPRCGRTVQRQREKLGEMGLVRYTRVRTRAPAETNRRLWDVCLSVRLLHRGTTTYVQPRLAEQEEGCLRSSPPPAVSQIPPPTAARDRPPDKPAGNGSDQEVGASAGEEPGENPNANFDFQATRRRIESELASGERKSIFERFGVSLE